MITITRVWNIDGQLVVADTIEEAIAIRKEYDKDYYNHNIIKEVQLITVTDCGTKVNFAIKKGGEMKANELTIGDWVNLKNGKVIMPCRITVIGHATQDRNEIGTTVCVDLSKEFPTCIFDMNVIIPIPITPEILEKNGFVKELDSDGIHYRFTLIQGCSQFSLLYARSVFQWLCPIDFKYVHELQHILKLFKIEKTIEL